MTGFPVDSSRNPDGFHSDSETDSALNKAASQPASQAARERPRSSRSDAQRGRLADESLTSRIRSTPFAIALTRLVLTIRPEWRAADVYGWALNDDRPEAHVIAAGINGARDRSIREPAGLRYAGPAAPSPVMTYPTVNEALTAVADANLCEHGSVAGACPFCRRAPLAVVPEEGA